MKTWWQCELVEATPPCRRFDLGCYEVEDRETAQARCEKRFRNLIRKFETQAFSVRVFPTVNPIVAEQRKQQRARRADKAVADLFPDA